MAQSAFERFCEQCGSHYHIVGHKISMRDKDTLDCEVCGEELLAWNGGVMYRATLLRRAEKYKNS